MTAALGRYVRSNGVALQTEIVFAIAAGRFQQDVLIFRSVRIVALETIPDVGRMDVLVLHLARAFVGVALQAKLDRRRRDQLDARDVFGDAQFVAGQTTRCDRGVNYLTLGFIFVASRALRRIGVLLQRDGVLLSRRW